MRIIRLLLTAVLIVTACVAPGCSKASVPQGEVVRASEPRIMSPDATEDQVADLIQGGNAFAFDLYRAAVAGNTANLIFSPYSISTAFSMVYAGAGGATADQMQAVLGYLPQEAQHPAMNALDLRLAQLQEKVPEEEEEELPFRLNIANALWGQQGFPFKATYLETLAGHYDAGLRVVDFATEPEAAREAINAWVEEETEGRIKDLAGPGSITPDTRLVLGNAIYFQAAWVHRFREDQTADGPFTLPDGSQVTVPLMHQTMRLAYAQGEGFQAARLPYRGQGVDMWVILPEMGHFADIEQALSPEWLDEVGREAKDHEVILTLPRFDFETDLALSDLLQEMGVRDLFGPADLSGMAEASGLFVSDALHRANITVMEEGTQAAAATLVAVAVSLVPQVEMTVDHPFILAIVARDSGAILFLGRVTNPAA